VQHHAFVGAVEAVDRAHRHAGRVAAVHAGHRDRLLAGHAVVERDHAAAVHAPGHLVLVLAGGHAAVALDAALGITDEFHSCHVVSSLASRSILQIVVLVSCIIVTLS
jgi:hypothetical protein